VTTGSRGLKHVHEDTNGLRAQKAMVAGGTRTQSHKFFTSNCVCRAKKVTRSLGRWYLGFVAEMHNHRRDEPRQSTEAPWSYESQGYARIESVAVGDAGAWPLFGPVTCV
jgi:hypothetical protein